VAGGANIGASGNHPFYTPSGWKNLEDIKVGEYVAVTKVIKTKANNELTNDLALLLGLMMGDGSYTYGRPPSFCCGHDVELGKMVEKLAINEFGVKSTWIQKKTDKNYNISFNGISSVRKSNNFINWLREISMYGQKHNDLSIPEIVFTSNDSSVRSFLSGLFVTDGSMPKTTHASSPVIYYSTVSKIMADQVRLLLLRLRIPSSIQINKKTKERKFNQQTIYQLIITGIENVDLFMKEVGFCGGDKERRVLEVWNKAKSLQSNHKRGSRSDNYPPEICYKAIESIKSKKLRSKFSMVKGRGITKRRLLEVVSETGDEYLEKIANGEIGFLKVKSIEPLGKQETYDFCVPPYGNFIANGFVVHNTSNIEQSSDASFGCWYPIKSEKEGNRIEGWTVNKNLFFLRLLKQKLGEAPATWALHVDPERRLFANMTDERKLKL
jgi:intein/homing endonuclease